MTKHLVPLFTWTAMAVAIAVVIIMGRGTTQAEFSPLFQPCSEVSVDNPTANASSDINTVFGTGLNANCDVTTNRDEHKQYNFGAILAFSPPEWFVPADADIADGAQVGRLEASARLGLVNNPCTNTLPVGFDLLDATTDQSNPIVAKAPGEKDRLSPLAVIEGNGIPAGANKWPTYINDVLDEADFSQVRARLFGANTVTVPGTTVILNFMIFEAGARITNRLQIDPALGPFSVTILQDPSAEASDEDPVNDFCAPLRSATSFLGTASDSSTFRTNPGDGNYNFVTAAMSQRDVDLDGIENSLDPCLFVPNPPEGESDYWDPRGPSVQPGDRDGDGIPNVCDPDPDNIPHPGNDPCSGTSGVGLVGTDEDCDRWMNMGDNCPLVKNEDQNDEDDDGLGDACDVAGKVITRGDGSSYTLLGPNVADADDSILGGPLVTTITIGAGGAPAPTADQYIADLDCIGLDLDKNGVCDFLQSGGPTPPPTPTDTGGGGGDGGGGAGDAGGGGGTTGDTGGGTTGDGTTGGGTTAAASGASLTTAITSATVTELQVSDASSFSVGDFIQIGDEILEITAIDGNTLTVKRGVRGTTATPHESGADILVIKDDTAVAGVTGGTGGTGGAAGGPDTGVGSLAPLAASIPAWAAIASGLGGAGLLGSLAAMASRILRRRR